MKTKLSARSAQPAGHILMTMLFVTAVIGVSLASYLKLTHTQNQFTARSQIWNNCMPLIEAGIEEALCQINTYGNTNLVASGWLGTSTSFYKENDLGGGYYRVSVNFTNALAPIVISTGYLPAPPTLAMSGHSMMAAAFVPNPNVKYMSRTVRANLRKEPALNKGMVAKDQVDLGGNQCSVDSYDSSKGPYGGANIGDKGDVAVNSDVLGVVGLGNAKIKGHLSTGPKATIKKQPNACVGSLAWHASPGKGVQPGWIRNDMNLDIPDVTPPWAGSMPAPPSQGSWNYSLGTDNYQLNSLTINSSTKMKVSGKAVLYVKGNVTITGDKYLKIDDGCSLTLYVGGSTITLNGTYDKSDVPADMMIFGLPSVKTIDANGVAAVIYAPSATLNLNGNAQFWGATVTKTVRMNGNTNFHYDEALEKLPYYRQYVITSWTEI